MMRRCRAALAALMVAVSSAALAQTYPERPVRIIVPYPAGGSNDVVARLLGQKLSEAWGHQVIIENRGGAGGNLGAEAVATATADGYTLLLTAPSPLTVNQNLYRLLPFDPATDFTPIALVATVPIVLMVHPALAAKSVAELTALARAQPGKLNFGSSGNGTTNHLAGELYKSLAGINIVHVPYRGAAPAMNDLIGGHIQIMFDNMPAVLPQAKSGTVRALAVAGTERSRLLPDLPTMSEAGVAGFVASAWFGLVAPAKTPPAVVSILKAAVTKALADPEIAKKFGDLGANPGTLTGDAMRAFMEDETRRWARVIEASGAKID